MKKIISYVLLISLFYICTVMAKGSYQEYNLPFGISVSIPIGWIILDKNTNRQLDNFTEALTNNDQSNNDILIAANCYTNKKIAVATFRISVRKKNPDFTQNDLNNMSKEDLEELRQISINISKLMNKNHNAAININSIKVDIRQIGGLKALNIKKNVANNYPKIAITNLYIIPMSYGLIKIHTSYDKNEEFFVTIINKMLSSVKISQL